MDLWIGNRKRILVLNREDMISTSDRNAWATHYARQGIKVVFANGQLGMVIISAILFSFSCSTLGDDYIMWCMQGSMKLSRLAKSLAADVNVKRRARGLLPRPVISRNFVYYMFCMPGLLERVERSFFCFCFVVNKKL